MTNTDSRKGIFDIDITTMHDLFNSAVACCLDNAQQESPGFDVPPDALNKSMQQYFGVISAINTQTQPDSAIDMDEMTDLADYGLSLLEEFSDCAQKLNCEESFSVFEQLSIPLAVWAAQQNLTINNIELVVNAISNTANHTEDKEYLSELIDTIEVIIKSIGSEIKADLDKSNMGRPWRILNLNQGIIATRCQDPKRMEAVFEQLLYRLPDDAAGFFAEGMEQMDSIDYPEHVRDVMQKYFHQTNKPTLH